MIENKRFQLMSVHFRKLEFVIYDNLEDIELNLSIYELVDLLNNVSQRDYDLKKLKVSERYKVCREYSEFNDKELSRKWSN